MEGEIAAGGEVAFPLTLEAGTYVRFAVEQRGADLALALVDPDGGEIVADAPIGGSGCERLPAVAAVQGEHRLAVRNQEESPAAFRLRVEALRPASGADRAVAETYLRHREVVRWWYDLTADRQRLVAEAGPLAEAWEEMAERWRRADEPAFAGRALLRLAGVRHLFGDQPRAVAAADAARAAFERSDEAELVALAVFTAANAHHSGGDREVALAAYDEAVELARAAGDAATEAGALRGMGRIHRTWGELQAALDRYEEALAKMPATSAEHAPLLSDLGVLRARFLADVEGGRELIVAARDGYGEGYERQRAVALNQLAQLDYEESRFESARRGLEAALELLAGPCDRAIPRARLALVDAAEGRRDDARRRVAEALAEVGGEGCRGAATVHLLAGQGAERLGDEASAEGFYRRCAELHEERGDRSGAADCLARLAGVRRRLGDPEGALAAGREALSRLEPTRPTVLRTDLRMSFASELERPFDAVIGALLDLGRDEEAWVVAERARARALGDLLREAAAGLRGTADRELLARERELRRRVNALESSRLAARDDEEARALAEEISAAVDQLERLRGEMRRGAPSLAAAESFTAAELRSQLDAGALLLEYRLGGEESVLWAVDRDGVVAHRLEPRREIEPLAARVGAAMGGRRLLETGACDLARRLLAPVAGELGERPLVLVPDGALEAISFAALPDPAAGCRERLVERHAVSYLPSVATLAEQRRRLADRPVAARWLAMVADPVYSPAGRAEGRGDDADPLRRLRHARREAEEIAGLLPAGRTRKWLGASASRDAVLGGALGGARLVHVASHGRLHGEEPLLSRLELSRFTAGGEPIEGAVSALEIYDLDLAAELVVLSACDTAGGRQVRGEGLVAGLPRAFLYAGAERVVVSLWAVDDRATSQLMVAFYRALLDDGLPPAEALRAAQRSVQRERPSPYWWAAFVLQGDPQPLHPFAR